MLDLIIKTATIIGAFGAVLGIAVGGFLYVAGIFKKGKGQEDDRLINILSTTVTELEKKVNSQQEEHTKEINTLTNKIDGLSMKIIELEKENKTLVAVLQGRDDKTLEFQKEVLSAVATASQTHELCRSTNENVMRLCTVIEKHLQIIEHKKLV